MAHWTAPAYPSGPEKLSRLPFNDDAQRREFRFGVFETCARPEPHPPERPFPARRLGPSRRSIPRRRRLDLRARPAIATLRIDRGYQPFDDLPSFRLPGWRAFHGRFRFRFPWIGRDDHMGGNNHNEQYKRTSRHHDTSASKPRRCPRVDQSRHFVVPRAIRTDGKLCVRCLGAGPPHQDREASTACPHLNERPPVLLSATLAQTVPLSLLPVCVRNVDLHSFRVISAAGATTLDGKQLEEEWPMDDTYRWNARADCYPSASGPQRGCPADHLAGRVGQGPASAATICMSRP